MGSHTKGKLHTKSLRLPDLADIPVKVSTNLGAGSAASQVAPICDTSGKQNRKEPIAKRDAGSIAIKQPSKSDEKDASKGSKAETSRRLYAQVVAGGHGMENSSCKRADWK